MMITKRQLLTASAGIALGQLAWQERPHAQASAPELKELHDAATREGELTWYTGQLQAEPSEAVGRAFTAAYPGVKVNVVRSTSQVAFQRIGADMRAGVSQCDVFSSTDLSHASYLKADGSLLAFRPRNADGLIESVRTIDPDNFYQVTYLALYQIAFQNRQVSEADAPKSWQDLLDPKWKNKLAVGHPSYSGAITSWCVLLKKLYGWEYFEALEKNQPLIGRSSADPVTTLNAGERVIGVAVPTATTLLSISRGNPITLIYPTDGTLMVPAPSGIMAKAPHPSAAKLFMEFMTSAAYFEATLPFFTQSMRPEVPSPEGAKPIAEFKLITPTAEEIEAEGEEAREQWRDTFGI